MPRRITAALVDLRLKSYCLRTENFFLELPDPPDDGDPQDKWKSHVKKLEKIVSKNKKAVDKIKKKCKRYRKGGKDPVEEEDIMTQPEIDSEELWDNHYKDLKEMSSAVSKVKKKEGKLRDLLTKAKDLKKDPNIVIVVRDSFGDIIKPKKTEEKKDEGDDGKPKKPKFDPTKCIVTKDELDDLIKLLKKCKGAGLPPKPEKNSELPWRRSIRNLERIKNTILPVMARVPKVRNGMEKMSVGKIPPVMDAGTWRQWIKDMKENKTKAEAGSKRGVILREKMEGNKNMPKKLEPVVKDKETKEFSGCMDAEKWEKHNKALEEIQERCSDKRAEARELYNNLAGELPKMPQKWIVEEWEDFHEACKKAETIINDAADAAKELAVGYNDRGWGADDLPSEPTENSAEAWKEYHRSLRDLESDFVENKSKAGGLEASQIVRDNMSYITGQGVQKPTKDSPGQWLKWVKAMEGCQPEFDKVFEEAQKEADWLAGNPLPAKPSSKSIEDMKAWKEELSNMKGPIQDFMDEFYNDVEPGITDSDKIPPKPTQNTVEAWEAFNMECYPLNPEFKPKRKPEFKPGQMCLVSGFKWSVADRLKMGVCKILSGKQAATGDAEPMYKVRWEDWNKPVRKGPKGEVLDAGGIAEADNIEEQMLKPLPDPIPDQVASLLTKFRKARAGVIKFEADAEKFNGKIKKLTDKCRTAKGKAETKAKADRTKAAKQMKICSDKANKKAKALEVMYPEINNVIKLSASKSVYVNGVMNGRNMSTGTATVERGWDLLMKEVGVKIIKFGDIGPDDRGYELGACVTLPTMAMKVKFLKHKQMKVSPLYNNDAGILKFHSCTLEQVNAGW